MCSEVSATHTDTELQQEIDCIMRKLCFFPPYFIFTLDVKHVVRWLPLESIWPKLKGKRERKCCSNLDRGVRCTIYNIHTLSAYSSWLGEAVAPCAACWTDFCRLNCFSNHLTCVHSSSLTQNQVFQPAEGNIACSLFLLVSYSVVKGVHYTCV